MHRLTGNLRDQLVITVVVQDGYTFSFGYRRDQQQLARLGVPVVTLPGLGHNAHVESPDLSVALLDPYR